MIKFNIDDEKEDKIERETRSLINLNVNKKDSETQITNDFSSANLSKPNKNKKKRFRPLLFSQSKRERVVTYKLGLILFTFILSWSPFCILWPLNSLCSTLTSNYECIPQNLYIFSFWLAYLNSLFTPFILLYNNTKYRKSIKIIRANFCFCILGRKKSSYNSLSSAYYNNNHNSHTPNVKNANSKRTSERVEIDAKSSFNF